MATEAKSPYALFSVSLLVCVLAILGVGAVAYYLVTGGANEQFAYFPVTVNLHVIPGAIYLLFAPLQFSKMLRNKSLTTHRWMGRLLTSLGLIIGISAVFMGVFIPYSGFSEQIIISIFGTFFITSLVLGFINARRSRIEKHREWMIRALAIGLSIATMRLIFVPALITLGSPTREETEFWSILAFTIAFILHSAFAEYWIISTRKNHRVDLL